jgi:inner membrane protein
MSPGAHLLASWLLANGAGLERRERRLVALAGVLPDLDGLGVLVDIGNGWRGTESDFFSKYHHLYGHNLMTGLGLSLGMSLLATKRRLLVFGLSLATFHLHLLCDLVGSKGPDGYQWPIWYLFPFDKTYQWIWRGQWDLNAWPNLVLLFAMFIGAVVWSSRQRYSFIEVISVRLDRAIFAALDRRWPT